MANALTIETAVAAGLLLTACSGAQPRRGAEEGELATLADRYFDEVFFKYSPTIRRRLLDRFDDALEQPAPVLAAEHALAEPLRVRHHADDVAARVGDAGDVAERAVRVRARRAARSVRVAIAEGDLAFALQPLQPFRIDVVVAVAVADGHADDLAPGVLARPGRHRVLHLEVHVAADVLQGVVAPHRPREHPRLEQDLEAVADAHHVAAPPGELAHLLHHRGEARDGSGAQVVAVGEAAGEHHHVRAAQVAVLVPDVSRGAPQHVLGDVVDVVVAVRAGEDDHGEEHQAGSSIRYSSMTVLARSFSHMEVRRSRARRGSFSSRSSSMIFPSLTPWTSPNPSEARARPTAWPCGSSTERFRVTTTRAFMGAGQ